MSLPVVGFCCCSLQEEKWLDHLPRPRDSAHCGSPLSHDAAADGAAAFELDIRLEELQATAKRMGRGIGLKHLGPQGFGPIRNLRHPDFEYFQSRQ